MSRRSARVKKQKRLNCEEGGVAIPSTSGCDTSKTVTSNDDKCENSITSETPKHLGESNPLLNDVVLHHLFDVCPMDVLATCRMVCKQWYEDSLKSWQNLAPLIVYLIDNNVTVINRYSGLNPLPMQLETYLEAVNNPETRCKPHRYIQIKDSVILPDKTTKGQLKLFWNDIGSKLTTLEFNQCEFQDNDEFAEIIFTRCPNLKRLLIENCTVSSTFDDSSDEEEEEDLAELEYMKPLYGQNKNVKFVKIVGETASDRKLPVSWLQLFSHFPSVSAIQIRGPPDPPNSSLSDNELKHLYEIIRIIRKNDEKALPIKYFDVGEIILYNQNPSTEQTLATFQELQLPFKDVCIIIQRWPTDYDFLDSIISAHAKTLKDLHVIKRTYLKPLTQFPFGHHLNNLSVLRITCSLMENMTFLNYIPNLVTLHINATQDNGLLFGIPSTPDDQLPPRSKLTELVVLCSLYEDGIVKLSQWMPNVIKLAMYLNDKNFGVVCEKWRNLKELQVFGRDLTDVGVTGIADDNVKGGSQTVGPNISYLQDLIKFGFESPKLSAKSVFHGFLQLPNLQLIGAMEKGKGVRWGDGPNEELLQRNVKCEGFIKRKPKKR